MAVVPIFGLLASPGTPTSHTFIYAFSGVSLLNKYPSAGFRLFPAVSLYVGEYLACPLRVDWVYGTSGSSEEGVGAQEHWG